MYWCSLIRITPPPPPPCTQIKQLLSCYLQNVNTCPVDRIKFNTINISYKDGSKSKARHFSFVLMMFVFCSVMCIASKQVLVHIDLLTDQCKMYIQSNCHLGYSSHIPIAVNFMPLDTRHAFKPPTEFQPHYHITTHKYERPFIEDTVDCTWHPRVYGSPCVPAANAHHTAV